ncbi:MAG: trypsin-like peptidase domain-containing protein, partial [Chloroflexi bacterium]|nr:trypsin-like peptidase domain-containing protein [Chloroflexota bacterium]
MVLLIVLMFATLACQAGTAPLPALPAPATQPPAPISVPITNPQAQQDALVNLYQRVNPGIVAIKVSAQDGSSSLGSGFVYDSEGDIVTNDHVVTGAKNNKVEVDFMSGYKTYGTIIGTDLDSDLAVIKVNAPATELYPLTLGDSSTLKVGQTVIAIGNP